jgi:hypothetical protein
MEPLPRRRIWLPSVDFMVFLGAVILVCVIAIPGLLSSARASNERNASTSLKTLTAAEADFRANDRDGNQVEDFWTGDVSGLYFVKPAGGGAEIRLIEESVAIADAKPLTALPKGPAPKAAYLYQALDRDANFKGPEGEYKRDTDKSGKKVHNEDKFGFCAYPQSRAAGNYVFRVNENNTIFREEGAEPLTTFPNDEELKKKVWSPGR